MELGAFSISSAVKDPGVSKSFYEKLGLMVFAGEFSQNWLIMKNGYILSSTDPLTSTYNRCYFYNALNNEIERSNRYKSSFSILMFDIDFFKSVNDNHGHDAGDDVLKALAETVKNGIRKSDVLARWGGEEFLILLPETNLVNAISSAEKLIAEVRNLVFEKCGSITVSIGVTEYRLNESPDSVLKRVDELVYNAKNDGRNRIRYAP
jgi:diguanylate cyclase (GGDEF)-like protein